MGSEHLQDISVSLLRLDFRLGPFSLGLMLKDQTDDNSLASFVRRRKEGGRERYDRYSVGV